MRFEPCAVRVTHTAFGPPDRDAMTWIILESAAIGVWVGAGSRSERDDEHGLSHLLEHMAFKGTQTAHRRPTSPRRSRRSAARSTRRPASRRRRTTRACSSPTCRSPSTSSSDILRNSVFDPEELEREQHVILQEIGAALDAPEDRVYDIFARIGVPGQPIGRNILGTAADGEGRRLADARPRISTATTAVRRW